MAEEKGGAPMSSYLDSLSTINNLTNKIAELKKQTTANSGNETEINNTLVSLQQSFSQMLNDLVTASDDNDNDKSKSDPFAFLTQSNQAAVAANSQTNTGTSAATTQTVDPNILATQYKLNVENIF
jgi:hypothetical protein